MKILTFASAREKLGFAELDITTDPAETPRAILARVAPNLSLHNLRPAVDFEYCDWDTPVGAAKELALIPPVSGG